jgi:type I restriction enzyme S subunit
MPPSVTQQALLPKLRFPEFREAGEWEEKELGDLCDMQAGKFIAAVDISEKRTSNLYPCFGGNGLRGYTKTFNQSGRYSLIGRQGALCGNITLASGEFYATEHAVVTTPKLNIHTDWLFYCLNLLNLNRFATGQAQPGLSIEVLEKVDCTAPASIKEQQKIADCLSSLDDLISAQAQKIDALKTHKKGLMQQLFPAEGETVPKLRFSEFREAGEWGKKELSSLCNYWNGASHEGSVTDDGEYFLISLNSIGIDGNLKSEMKRLSNNDNSLQQNDLVMVLSDVAHGNFLGLTDIVPSNKFVLNQRMAGLRLKESATAHIVFLRIYINKNQEYFKRSGQGSSQLNLTKAAVTDFLVLLPSLKEQQKIADCLSSLDDLISAHTQKLDALKNLKKGLMQQLFPAIDEVSA